MSREKRNFMAKVEKLHLCKQYYMYLVHLFKVEVDVAKKVFYCINIFSFAQVSKNECYCYMCFCCEKSVKDAQWYWYLVPL